MLGPSKVACDGTGDVERGVVNIRDHGQVRPMLTGDIWYESCEGANSRIVGGCIPPFHVCAWHIHSTISVQIRGVHSLASTVERL